MTTNVFDAPAGMLATDSRWSFRQGRWLFYIDDTNLDKIELYDDTAFMFAGKGRLIQQWKDWIKTKPIDESNMPPCEGICVCGVDMPTRTVKLFEGSSIQREGAFFAGSGANFACTCWESNRDARRSVETAKQLDPATGGTVKFVDFETRQHNLGTLPIFAPATIDEVDQAILTRGFIMDISAMAPARTPFKLSELAASGNTEVLEVKAKVEAGEISAEAPCDAMHSEWSPEAKQRLKSFLGDVFGWKK